jgi:predicted O-methyltransferase YrrM
LLDHARTYFERGGVADQATFEHGNALKLAEERAGPFDLLVLNHDTADYVRGFDIVRDLIAPDGVIVTDNVLTYENVQTPKSLLATLDGAPTPNDRTRIIADFYEHVLDDPDFETYVLPIDEGVAISCRV